MTYHSAAIRVVRNGASRPLDSAVKDAEPFGVLHKHLNAGAWTTRLRAWTVEHGRDPTNDFDWIDNCWFHVAVTADEAPDFLSSMTEHAEPWALDLIMRLDGRDTYIITAEEY